MADFCELLSELRKDHNMTQKELAAAVHVSVAAISNYETGTNTPGIEMLVALANYFHVSTDYLLGRCSSRENVDVLNQEILPNRTVGKLIEDIGMLTADQKSALSLLLNDMKFSTLTKEYQRKYQK
jgi:transcriptional regulator with XRE-family HTH domain